MGGWQTTEVTVLSLCDSLNMNAEKYDHVSSRRAELSMPS